MITGYKNTSTREKIFLINFLLFSIPLFTFGQYTSVEQIQVFGNRINNPVEVEVKRNQDKLLFYANNKSFYNYDFNLTFAELQNLTPRMFNYKTLLHPGTNKLFDLTVSDKEQPVNYHYQFTFRMYISGNPDYSYPYLVPISKGKTVILDTMKIQNNNITFRNHFVLNHGDTVFAARKGNITAVPDESGRYERIMMSTSLEILHTDGSIGVYLGVDPLMLLVKPGQTVYPGQPLGIIGESNVLIFHVFGMQEESRIKTITACFSGMNGEIIQPGLINGTKIYYPENIIRKELTSKEIKKYEKGNLYRKE
jgi:hypothetical protein